MIVLTPSRAKEKVIKAEMIIDLFKRLEEYPNHIVDYSFTDLDHMLTTALKCVMNKAIEVKEYSPYLQCFERSYWHDHTKRNDILKKWQKIIAVTHDHIKNNGWDSVHPFVHKTITHLNSLFTDTYTKLVRSNVEIEKRHLMGVDVLKIKTHTESMKGYFDNDCDLPEHITEFRKLFIYGGCCETKDK